MDHGWEQHSEVPFKEAIAKKASICLTYHNAKNTQIGFLYYPEETSICLRLSSPDTDQFNYFQIKPEDMITTLNTLIAAQDKADIHHYFGFYFDMQAAGEVSILAWEQWEPNYR